MDIKATVASSYRNRLLLIAVATMLYAAWCLYDGIIKYPEKQQIRAEFERIQERNPDNWQKAWEETAIANGWDGTQEPETVDAWNIRTQWIQFCIVFPIGSYCLFSMAVWSRRFIGADEDKLYAHGNTEFTYDQITSIDATRWDNKGIAIINYNAGSGDQTLVLDDWKYTREPTDQIFDRIREKIDQDKIIGTVTPTVAETQTATDTPPVTENVTDQA